MIRKVPTILSYLPTNLMVNDTITIKAGSRLLTTKNRSDEEGISNSAVHPEPNAVSTNDIVTRYKKSKQGISETTYYLIWKESTQDTHADINQASSSQELKQQTNDTVVFDSRSPLTTSSNIAISIITNSHSLLPPLLQSTILDMCFVIQWIMNHP
jgi:hypothetical protein